MAEGAVVRAKVDRRVTRTEKAICDAFFRLLKEKSYSEIKASEIIEKSGYSRQAFYLHYRSKEDLVNVIMEEHLDHIKTVVEDFVRSHPNISESRSEIRKLHRAIFSTVIEDRLKSHALHENSCFAPFALMFMNYLLNAPIPVPLFNYRQQRNLEYMNMIASYYLNATAGYWIETDFRISLDKISDVYTSSVFGPGGSFPINDQLVVPFIAHENIRISERKTKNEPIPADTVPASKETISTYMEALLQLMREDRKISVRSLSERAGYSRTTFYNYFESVPDLIEKTMDQELHLLLKEVDRALLHNNQNRQDVEKSFTPVFRHILKKRNYYEAFFKYDCFSSFVSQLIGKLEERRMPEPKLNKLVFDDPLFVRIISSYLFFGTIHYIVVYPVDMNARQTAHLFAKSFF
ncbi:MAG: TetR/AcrR family transcriptional regulator [Erysipelotrichaceae bacterium]|nr:TetR/AcrR family transcriptional regulator [Erysipelotrichaceae bacterium]MBR3168759.1 TetR/AcrR family transcriptional regulator [Erysipelotrichaceae bacterium]